ncbi:unnamed protein product [Cylicocyclus nassatus]|uniref:Uncharacterized protein n=1 Tax=Cylicocyclus nassatus TaxID=53992 RepID=A0AA36H8M7_CYLNA|nr:unnamed protein product [Cylicocyclus nassatus]
MLKRIAPSVRGLRTTYRLLSSDGKDSEGGSKKPPLSTKQVLGDDLLDAVNSVAEDLHKDDPAAKKEFTPLSRYASANRNAAERESGH